MIVQSAPTMNDSECEANETLFKIIQKYEN